MAFLLLSKLPRIQIINYMATGTGTTYTEELGTEETLEKLEKTSGRVVAASCRYATYFTFNNPGLTKVVGYKFSNPS